MKPVVFRGNQGRWFFTQYIFKLSHGVIVKAYVISSQGVMVQIPGRKIGLELLCKKTNNNNNKKKTNKLHTHTHTKTQHISAQEAFELHLAEIYKMFYASLAMCLPSSFPGTCCCSLEGSR